MRSSTMRISLLLVAPLALAATSVSAGPVKADKNKAPTVAVFDFKVLNDDKKLSHFGAGASEAIINKLVNDKALRVVEESQLDKAVNALARNQSGLFEEESALAI